jgi:hypothetical protein
MTFDLHLGDGLFGLSEQERRDYLTTTLNGLTLHHLNHSRGYRAIVEAMFPQWQPTDGVEGIPFLPVSLFKQTVVKSIPDADVFKTVTSSGTGGVPSRVFLDRETATRQTRALTSIMSHVLGPGRRPMLIIDTEAVLSDRSNRTARAAGVVGLMGLGRKHVFLLDDQIRPQEDRLEEFVRTYAGQPLLIFGFTYMVWQYLYQAFGSHGFDLSNAVLVHSGGWKQMESVRVDNDTFKRSLGNSFGIETVVNFYGMAEQVGSIFIEGEDGLLHPSILSDVIVRDPETWQPQPTGVEGVLQVLSVVPTSYPGHSLLTEDVGVIETIDDPRHRLGGKAFRVLGRLPKAELRGCSDTFAAGVHA